MKFFRLKQNGKLKKIILIASFIVVFFGLELAVIFYANYLFKKSAKVGGMDSATYSFLYRIDQRLSQMQSELNYVRSYIISQNK